MLNTKNLMEQLTGRRIVQALEDYLKGNFESFEVEHTRYKNAIELLRCELGAEICPSVDDVMDAIDKQTASNLLFSGMMGLQSNYRHFMDPMARTVLDVDFSVFLREDVAARLPEYEKAQDTIDKFCELLSETQKAVFEEVSSYVTYLETIGPKLAHYYGFLVGNELICNLTPGYHPDMVLTMQYGAMMEEYIRTVPET